MMTGCRFTFIVTAIFTATLDVASVQAASINLALRYSGSLAADGETPIGTPLLNTPPTHVPGAYHGFEVLMTLREMMPTQDFQAVQFDLNLDGFTPADFGCFLGHCYGGWIGNNPGDDAISAPAPIFAANADGGHPNDMKRIAAFATSPTGVKVRQPGEDNNVLRPLPFPFVLGTAYLQWDGEFGGGSIGLNIAPNGALPWGIYDGITPIALDASQFTTIGGSITFVPFIPEPATLSLVAMAMVGIGGFVCGRSRDYCVTYDVRPGPLS
jgi:hypothetical protein